MTTPPNTPTRWRPRFSVRTMVVIITVVCAYAACWGPTKKWGVEQVAKRCAREVPAYRFVGEEPTPILIPPEQRDHTGFMAYARVHVPLVVSMDKVVIGSHMQRHYYLWFFGFVAKLPYERKVDVTYPPIPTTQSVR